MIIPKFITMNIIENKEITVGEIASYWIEEGIL